MAKPILVVDANREFGILIRQSLEDEGHYQVKLAHNGQQAIEAASSQHFEVALIDFGLPDIPGIELVRQLSNLDSALSIVAIPHAGNPDQLADLPVAGVLVKPFYLPDLAKMLEKTLNEQSLKANWIQWDEPKDRFRKDQKKPAVEPAPRTAKLDDGRSGRRAFSNSLPTEQQLIDGLNRSPARAALIWHSDGIAISAGLSGDQKQALNTRLDELSIQIEQRRAITQYVNLPDEEQDLLLFATPWQKELTLVLLFQADRSFREVRQTTQDIAQHLESLLRRTDPKQDPMKNDQMDQGLTEKAEPANLPEDWVPESEFSSAQRALLDELAAIKPPPADPDPAANPPSQKPTFLDLPTDWIPSNQRSQAVLAMLAPQQEVVKSKVQPASAQSSVGGLVYNLVLVPRFPDHLLSELPAEDLKEWVHRICLAWDWRSNQVQIRPNFMYLRIELNADSAPGGAAMQLKADLARKILSQKIEWNSSLPSGRFFAQKHLLTSGTAPDHGQIERFVKQVRDLQGYTR